VRERWLGATGTKVPAIAVEGELELPPETLLLDNISDEGVLRAAHGSGRGVAVRASDAGAVRAALARPEVSCVLVPPGRRDLLDLDLRTLTYG
jgi:hypothetical protein